MLSGVDQVRGGDGLGVRDVDGLPDAGDVGVVGAWPQGGGDGPEGVAGGDGDGVGQVGLAEGWRILGCAFPRGRGRGRLRCARLLRRGGAGCVRPREGHAWGSGVLRGSLGGAEGRGGDERGPDEGTRARPGEQGSRQSRAVARDEGVGAPAQRRRRQAQHGQVGDGRAQEVPEQEREGEDREDPHDQRLGSVGRQRGRRVGEVEGVEGGRRRADKPQECVGQGRLTS